MSAGEENCCEFLPGEKRQRDKRPLLHEDVVHHCKLHSKRKTTCAFMRPRDPAPTKPTEQLQTLSPPAFNNDFSSRTNYFLLLLRFWDHLKTHVAVCPTARWETTLSPHRIYSTHLSRALKHVQYLQLKLQPLHGSVFPPAAADSRVMRVLVLPRRDER